MSTEPLDLKSSLPLNNLNPKWWYLYGAAYDFSNFVERHPGKVSIWRPTSSLIWISELDWPTPHWIGGDQAISLGQGRDCTALFESYHTQLFKVKSLLRKYKVEEVTNRRDKLSTDNYTFLFEDDGFYHCLKKVRVVLYPFTMTELLCYSFCTLHFRKQSNTSRKTGTVTPKEECWRYLDGLSICWCSWSVVTSPSALSWGDLHSLE